MPDKKEQQWLVVGKGAGRNAGGGKKNGGRIEVDATGDSLIDVVKQIKAAGCTKISMRRIYPSTADKRDAKSCVKFIPGAMYYPVQ